MVKLIENRDALVKYISDRIVPKIYEQKKFSEVYTPLDKIEEMLDLLPSTIWRDPTTTWYDPAAGMGNFCICVYYRLMEGLSDYIKVATKRSDFIIKNMLYMCELNVNNAIIIKLIFGNTNLNLHIGDSLKFNPLITFDRLLKKSPNFSVIMGNPPYYSDMSDQGKKPLYNLFIEKYINMCKYMLFVVPSRWFTGGQGLDKFRSLMLSRKDLKFINHIEDAREWFGPHVNIKGGINYFLKDSSYNGNVFFNGISYNLAEFDVLVNPGEVSFLKKILHIIKTNHLGTLSDIYRSTSAFGIQTNDSRFKLKGKVTCYVSEKQNKQRKLYFNNFIFNNKNYFWKVITPAATQGSHSGFGYKTILSPNEIYSKSYISFQVNSKDEAVSLLSYLNCELPNILLASRKMSQQINKTTCSWIPLVPLDRIWTNTSVEKFLNL